MTSENIRALVQYRLEQADEFVKSGISPKELSRWPASSGRWRPARTSG
jgi:hypothetical protein